MDRKPHRGKVDEQVRLLAKFLAPGHSFLELRAGDCQVSLDVAKYVRKVIAVDVSNEIIKGLWKPDNFELVLSDGCTVDAHIKGINVAYSNNLMEHLHPDDAFCQLQCIYSALAPGGVYIYVLLRIDLADLMISRSISTRLLQDFTSRNTRTLSSIS